MDRKIDGCKQLTYPAQSTLFLKFSFLSPKKWLLTVYLYLLGPREINHPQAQSLHEGAGKTEAHQCHTARKSMRWPK